MTAITLNDLTTGTTDGTGIFDKLMASTKAHLELEFRNGRIKGAEYAQVYLGQVNQVMQTSVAFLSEMQKIDLEAQLLQAQIDQAQAQTALINAQTNNAIQDVQKMFAEIRQLDAQSALAGQQLLNAQAELLNTTKQGALLDAQAAQVHQQTTNMVAEALNIPKQGALVDAQTQVQVNQAANELLQGEVLKDQDCLLKAQYDGTLQSTLNTAAQTALYTQKVVTEKAQTMELGVDTNSVIGRQKDLYEAQINGFQRDAEQKAAKLFADSWSARRMTDDATQANTTNMLDDATVGRVMNKVLAGIQA